jgi:hypothetical protein
MRIRRGKADVHTDTPAHTPGVPEGNVEGDEKAGHRRDGHSTAARSTGINPKLHDPIDPRMPNLSPP